MYFLTRARLRLLRDRPPSAHALTSSRARHNIYVVFAASLRRSDDLRSPRRSGVLTARTSANVAPARDGWWGLTDPSPSLSPAAYASRGAPLLASRPRAPRIARNAAVHERRRRLVDDWDWVHWCQ
jgi:hypothetical protein